MCIFYSNTPRIINKPINKNKQKQAYFSISPIHPAHACTQTHTNNRPTTPSAARAPCCTRSTPASSPTPSPGSRNTRRIR